jgi:hypothetical protein
LAIDVSGLFICEVGLYRKQIRPVITDGAETVDRLFRVSPRSASAKEADQEDWAGADDADWPAAVRGLAAARVCLPRWKGKARDRAAPVALSRDGRNRRGQYHLGTRCPRRFFRNPGDLADDNA